MGIVEDTEYNEIPDDGFDHLKMVVDLEEYMKEIGLGEYYEEVKEYKSVIRDVSNTNEYSGTPRRTVAAAYRAATGVTYGEAAEKFDVTRDGENVDEPYGDGVRCASRNLGFSEEQEAD
jgi:hypothetical protein